MAAFRRLLPRARYHCSFSPLIRSYTSPNSSVPWVHRSLCSSSSPLPRDPNPLHPSPPNEAVRQTIPLQPVSYPVKPKDPSPPPPPASQPPQPPLSLERPDTYPQTSQSQFNAESRAWSREDLRFVKDFNPSVSPVSYQPRVAPLPEDRPSFQSWVAPLPEDRPRGDSGDGEVERLEAERRRIEAENRVLRRVFRVDEQQTVPFPTLIKGPEQAKKGQKVVHDLKEAIQLVKVNAKRNFDETLEAHVKLAVDLRRTDLKLTGSLSLPHGSGKSLRVAVFAEGAAADEARAAGADLVGGEDLIEGIKNGSVNLKEIDKCIAVPQLMPRIGKEISKKLNRLTPNARDGSVTTDISRAVKDAKKNIKFKKDKTAIVHVGLGKVSFPDEALCENVGAFVHALLLAKPAGLKKTSKYAGYVNTFHICSTMGPSFPVSIQSLSTAADRYNKLQIR